jgi:hypothetical protein
VCHGFTGPHRTPGRARIKVAQLATTTPQAHPRELQWDTDMGVSTQVTMRVVVTTPLTVTLSLASELEPPPLLGTPTDTFLWKGTSVIGWSKLSTRWKGSDDSSDG